MKGSYILVLFLSKRVKIEIGALGVLSFSKGYYLYVGSAMGNIGSTTLENRIKRHLTDSANKKIHWHIDYLLNDEYFLITKLYIVPSLMRLECVIARAIKEVSDSYIKNFGSTDCSCKSHLFYFNELRKFM
ncbi:MAG: endonuclease [Promethearchaeota archaeon Loki_b31]|nr:MAG: endonuclease [Candidatus Lokiarchaeota archaeon Loki_b31]